MNEPDLQLRPAGLAQPETGPRSVRSCSIRKPHGLTCDIYLDTYRALLHLRNSAKSRSVHCGKILCKT